MQNKLKVLHVIPSVSPLRGGPSKAVIEMVAALRASGVDAEIATTNDDGQTTMDVPVNVKTEYQGVPVYFFSRFSPSLNAVREFSYSNEFRRWIKTNIDNYDLVHIHAIFSFCSSYAMHIARKKKIPYIVRTIGQLEAWSLSQSAMRKKLYLSLCEKNNLQSASKLHFTASSELDQSLQAIPSAKGVVIPLGIHIPNSIDHALERMLSRWQLKPNTPTLLYLSRLHPKKGLEQVLTALSQLKHIPFQLVIAGEGEESYTNTLFELIERLKLTKHCHFIGFVEGTEKELLLQAADLFVLTSHSENFGIAALESMAAGTAVLISKGVALSPLVSEHQLGFVSNINQDEITLTLEKALTELQTSDDVSKMGERARRFVKDNYQWSAISQQLMSLYQEVRHKAPVNK